MIAAEGFDRGRHRALAARGAQANVDLVQAAFGGLHRQGGDHGLGQAGVIGARGQGAFAVGLFNACRVIDQDQIKVGPGIQPPRPQAAHAQHHSPTPRHGPVFGGEIGHHHGPKGCDHCFGQISIGFPGLEGVNQPAQVMDADAEVPFLHPCAGGVQLAFVIGGISEFGRQIGGQIGQPRPRRKERSTDHPVQHAGIARQVAGKIGGGACDINDQVNERGVGLKQRKDLHAGGQARQEAIQRHQRLIGVGGALQGLEECRAQAAEDGGGAV